ncbi:MAG: phosphoglycerate kinase [Deinococcus sp.]|nr:phosphoglycerate kinase [Deinococcus sp.]
MRTLADFDKDFEAKYTLDENFSNVLVRVDYNVPIKDGRVTDDTRIKASLPTIKHLLGKNLAVILMSHLGRPKGKDPAFSLQPVVKVLQDYLHKEVKFIKGPPPRPSASGYLDVLNQAGGLLPGSVALLENVRFNDGEEANDDDLAQGYARLGDAFVLDAFGSAHRAHASVTGITKHLPSYAGRLMEKEVSALSKLIDTPSKPYWMVLGGAKVSDKIGLINKLLPKVDGIVIGGAMAFTFIKARGGQVGNSLVEDDKLDLARWLIQIASAIGVKLQLPTDVVAAKKIEKGVETTVFPANRIPEGWMGLDIGPDSQKDFAKALQGAHTVFWNGPMGVFETPPFDAGTLVVGKAIAELSGAFTVVGGGDSVAAANKLGVSEKFSHVSTGGGASLEFLESGTLPGIEALS